MTERADLLDGRVMLYRGDCREILPMNDAAREFTECIAALRALWLAERRDGETVADWLTRTGRRKGVLA